MQNYHKVTMEELHKLEEDIQATQQAEEQAMVTCHHLPLITMVTLQLGHLQGSPEDTNRKADIAETKVSLILQQ